MQRLFTFIPVLMVVFAAIGLVLNQRRKLQRRPRMRSREPQLKQPKKLHEEQFATEEKAIAEMDEEEEGYARVVMHPKAEQQSFSQSMTPAPQTVTPQEKPNPQAQSLTDAGIIALAVMAKPGHQFGGYELLQALLTAGLRYGKMNIFHRHEDISGRGAILFSLASISKPGIFDLAKMGSFQCPGLYVFMRVSGQKDLMQALNIMIDTARQLADDLGGEVLDDERRLLSYEKIQSWRERIYAYEQGQHTADLFA